MQTTGHMVNVGELVVFNISVHVPQGTTSNLTLTTTVSSGLELLSSSLVFERGVSSSLMRAGSNCSLAYTNGVPMTLDCNLGQVLRNVTGLADNNQIVVLVTAQVLNLTSNVNGTLLNSSAKITYRQGTSISAPTVQLTVLEPFLRIRKTATPSYGQAGTTVLQSVSVSQLQQSLAPAFNVTIYNFLEPWLTLLTGTVTASSGLVISGNNAGDASVSVLVPVLLPGVSSVEITFESIVNLAAQAGTTSNLSRAQLTWSSSPFAGVFRISSVASGLPLGSFTMAQPSIQQGLQSTSFQGSASSLVAIGDLVVFNITLDLPRGSTVNVTVIDQLPATTGKLFGLNASVTLASGVSGPSPWVTLSDSNKDGITDLVVFNLGTLVNNNTLGQTKPVQLQVTAYVPDIASNSKGTVLQNNVKMTYGLRPQTISAANVSLKIDDPALLIEKRCASTGSQAGDSIFYTIVVSQPTTDQADAYNLVITDALNPFISLLVGSVAIASGNGTVVSGNSPGDMTVVVTVPSYVAQAAFNISITFTGVVTTAAQAGESIATANAILRWTSDLTGSASRNYSATSHNPSSCIFNMTVPSQLDQVLAASSFAETSGLLVGIGETVTFNITLQLPRGTTTNLTIIDQLPSTQAKLLALSSSVFYGAGVSGSSISDGGSGTLSDSNADGLLDRVTFTLGEVVATTSSTPGGSQLTLQVVALVLNVPSNANGTALVNSVRMSYTSGGNVRSLVAANLTLTAVEPYLEVTSSCQGPTTGQAGDFVNYTIQVAHTSGSYAQAFNVNITETLNPSILLLAGSLFSSQGIVASASTGQETTISVVVPLFSPYDLPITINYTGVVSVTATAGTTLVPNPVAVNWTSSNDQYGRKSSVQTGEPDSSCLFLMISPNLTQTITNSSFDAISLPVVNIGEILTIDILVDVPLGTTPNVTIFSYLPTGPGMLAVTSSLIVLGPEISSSLAIAGASGDAIDSNGDGQSDEVLFRLGSVIRQADVGLSNNQSQITLQVAALVINYPGNFDGVMLTAQALMQFQGPGLQNVITNANNLTVQVAEPEMIIIRTCSPPFGEAGDIIHFHIIVQATPASSTTAYQLQVTDLPDSEMQLDVGSVTTNRGIIVSGNNPTDSILLVTLPSFALGEASWVIGVNYTIKDSAITGSPLISDAILNWTSAPTGDAGRAYNVLASNTTRSIDTVFISDPMFTQILTSTSLSHSPITHVSIGEFITSTVYLEIPSGTTLHLYMLDMTIGSLAFNTSSVALAPWVSSSTIGQGGQGTPFGDGGFLNGARFDLGTVVCEPGHSGVPAINISITTLVLDVPDNVDGTLLYNTVSMNSSQMGFINAPNVTVLVVEPFLQISKSWNVTAGHLLQAGDIVTFTITFAHTASSASAAYGIYITDPLATSLSLVVGSVNASMQAVSVLTGDQTGDTTLQAYLPVLLLTDDPVIMEFSARVIDTIESSSNLSVPGSMVDWSSAPRSTSLGRVRNTTSNGLSVDTASPAFFVSVGSTSLQLGNTTLQVGEELIEMPFLAIGEQITYNLTVTLPKGVTSDLELSLALSASPYFYPVASQVAFVGSSLSVQSLPPVYTETTKSDGSKYLEFYLGQVIASDWTNPSAAIQQLVLQVTCVLPDLPSAYNGETATSIANIDYALRNASGQTDAFVHQLPVRIVEPSLVAELVGIPATDGSNQINYKTHLYHGPNSTAPAYNVTLSDLLDPLVLSLISGTTSSSLGVISEDGGIPSVAILELQLGDDVFFNFTVLVNYSFNPSSHISTQVNFTYHSCPQPFGRAYHGKAQNSQLTLDIPQLSSFSVASSISQIGYVEEFLLGAAVGESLAYQVVVLLAPRESPQQNITIVIDLYQHQYPDSLSPFPGNLTLGSPGIIELTNASILSLGDNVLSSGWHPGSVALLTDTNGDGLADRATFSLGVLAFGSNYSSVANTLILQALGRVSNSDINVNGLQMASFASLYSGNLTVRTRSVGIEIVEPLLALVVDANATKGDAGDVLSFTTLLSYETAR